MMKVANIVQVLPDEMLESLVAPKACFSDPLFSAISSLTLPNA